MKRRRVHRVSLEPASSSKKRDDCQKDTPYVAKISVACTQKMRYGIDEAIFLTVRHGTSLSKYTALTAYFEPDGSDILEIRVNDKLSTLNRHTDSPSRLLFDQLLDDIEIIHEMCGGRLCVISAISPINRHPEAAFRKNATLLLRALQVDWIAASDEAINAYFAGMM